MKIFIDFPVPSRDVSDQWSLTKLSLGGNDLINPGQGEFGYSDIKTAGDGKIANLLFTV